MKRVATVDIGTNSVLLLIAESSDAGWKSVLERATVTRLGQGVDKTGELHPDALARTSACLREYAALVRAADVSEAIVVGTSAMRDARGGDVLRALVRAEFGVEARTLSGDEEARATFAGATSGLGVQGACTVFDIGGGSTEFVTGDQSGIGDAHSFDVGAVRMHERHLRGDPPREEELAALVADVNAIFASRPVASAAVVIGVAGTVTTLCAWARGVHPYDGALVHGQRMSRDEVAEAYAQLARMPLDERQALPGLDAKRADVIVAGAAIAVACLDFLGARELVVSDRGVRWGLLQAL